CGPNCEVRTITFDDGSTLVMHESIVGVESPGNSSAAGTNAPMFLDITQAIVGGTGRFAGATGSGAGRVNLAANALITASGTITLAGGRGGMRNGACRGGAPLSTSDMTETR